MRFIRNRWLVAGIVTLLVAIPSAWLMARSPDAMDGPGNLVASVKQGEFRTVVTTSGELRASNFVQVSAPATLQQAGVWQVRIASLVPEGTIVKEGDPVAELDRSALMTQISDVTLNLQKAEAQLEQAMLDSTLNLSKAREEIRTMELALEEKRLAKEQSVYEAPTVQRQAEIELEKAQRALDQARIDYKTKVEQAQAKVREVSADAERHRNRLRIQQEVLQGFTIRAPAPGMIVYVREWNGRKRTQGSQLWAGEPNVATLPDLTQMESITYVNEIDVRRIAAGQQVVITLDADPAKQLRGKVTSVANIGEQRPNSDAKVFEVKVEIAESDTTLLPGMTTGNAIETFKIPDALFVPIEAVASDNGTAVVFKRDGLRVVKQEVETGAMNDDEVVIVRGLAATDRVLLLPPPDRDRLPLVHLAGGPAAVGTPPADSAEPVLLGAPGDSAASPRQPLPRE